LNFNVVCCLSRRYGSVTALKNVISAVCSPDIGVNLKKKKKGSLFQFSVLQEEAYKISSVVSVEHCAVLRSTGQAVLLYPYFCSTDDSTRSQAGLMVCLFMEFYPAGWLQR
jgi:hypothetical protein